MSKRKKVSLILLWDIMRRKDCWADQESDASTPWAPMCPCELSLHKCLLCCQFSRCTDAYAPQDGAFKAAYFPVLPSHFPFWTVTIWVCECLGKQNQYSNGEAHRFGGSLEDCSSHCHNENWLVFGPILMNIVISIFQEDARDMLSKCVMTQSQGG